ncbi:MAG: hypothetical protein ACRD4H_03905, partial [Candidatus Acidiferrales bacterium]
MRRWFTSTFAFLGILSGIFLVGCTGSSSPPITVTITNPASSPTIEGGQTVNVTTSGSNDSANKGVTWSLSGQGSLTNQTSTSVTYKAPASVASNIMATVTAMSVADTSKSAAISITVAAVSVTIRGKVMQLAAANTTLVLFSAAVQNDPSNGGVTWTLMSNGTLCSPACGSLSLVTGFDVFYRPPASVPGAPNNMPTIAATSVTDPTKSDIDAFTIFDGATACAPGGSESLLNGEYAILLQGWTGSGAGKPTMFAASFGADGAGKITGGIATVNDFTSSSSGGSLIASASSYSVGPDGRGCLTLTNES